MTEHLQSAYKANNSTETALLKVREDILQTINHREVTCLVLLDLSVAFDTVDHHLLLNRLKHRFRVVGKAYDWIKSYLSDQTQQVVVGDIALGGATSSKSKLKQGIPQGSVLGPILLTLYISPLGDICQAHGISFQIYADDQQNYASFKPVCPKSRDECITKIQNCISDIQDWMHTNLLKLNDSKTKVIMIGTPQMLKSMKVMLP